MSAVSPAAALSGRQVCRITTPPRSTLTGRVFRIESRALTLATWSEESAMNGTGAEMSHLESPLSTNGKMVRVKLELAP